MLCRGLSYVVFFASQGSYSKQLMQNPDLLKSQVLKEVDQLFEAGDKGTK
jgi:hypothetical protein